MNNDRPIYCPACFNHTCFLKESGKVTIFFDGKKKASGVFIFNIKEQRADQIYQVIKEKLEEYFIWYGEFKNKEPLKKIDLFSSDFLCEKGCTLNNNLSVVGILISENKFKSLVHKLAKDYDVFLDF